MSMNDSTNLARRRLVAGGAAVIAGGGLGAAGRSALAQSAIDLPIANGHRNLVAFPEKRPLIVTTSRPPQLETPFEVFDDGVVTPNDAFFVRYHLAGVPTTIDVDSYRITVKGKVATPLSLSVADLKTMDAIEYYAVNQC